MKQTKRMRLVEGTDQNSDFGNFGWENLPYTVIHAIAKLDLKILNLVRWYSSRDHLKPYRYSLLHMTICKSDKALRKR